jgi:uncharacterized membrane protein YkvI
MIDLLYLIHLLMTLTLFTIPFWPHCYLKYGVYIPLIISFIWIVCNGCPLTKIQTNLNSDNFTKEILTLFFPNITTKYTEHVNTFVLILVTVVGFNRLKK